MGDEAQKRNTDCVYFLASPLTCKKGTECEYRHSEAARVNPRDCWYWLSGNCLNASCSFRHPPLDGRPGASAAAPSQAAGGSSAVPTATAATPSVPSTSAAVSVPPTASKSSVLCFFFSQGYCAKGGKCPYSHAPTIQYRKEALTYQRPQLSEQPANGEGNGVPHPKPQFQDRKPASQVKAPVRAGHPLQEAGIFPSNVYKRSASGATAPSVKRLPGISGERTDQSAQVGRLKPANKADDNTIHGQLMESRVPQSHLSNECAEHFSSVEKGVFKGHLSHLDSGRTTLKQVQQSSATYSARVSEKLINPETQDPVFEQEGQYSIRELHAGDLRNHLKRKKNDANYLSQIKDNHGKDFLKDRSGVGRLASRAVPVTELKDFLPNNTKRAKQEKESSTFSGPKSLAQIKAEKAKNASQGGMKAAEALDDCRIVEPDPMERKEVVESTSELRVNLLSESYRGSLSDHSGMLIEETKSEKDEGICSVALESAGRSQDSRHGVVMNSSNGLSADLVSLRASKEAEPTTNHSSEGSILKGRESLRNEEILHGNKHAYYSRQGSHTETDYVSADELMEDGSEALENAGGAEYAFDEEEDDFARKLGSFLS